MVHMSIDLVFALYVCRFVFVCVFFFKQKTAYDMRISDWSSDVCSSDLMGSALFSAFAFAPDVQAQSVPDPSQSDAASPVHDAPSQGVGDIVVTARRRSESLQNMPVAVTATNGAALEQKGETNTSAVAHSTPSLTHIGRASGREKVGEEV